MFRWQQQQERLGRLNTQAVLSASQQEEEFVKEFLITYEKVCKAMFSRKKLINKYINKEIDK